MAAKRFDNELETLNVDIIKMGSMIEDAINETLKILIDQDKELAEEVIKKDKEINIISSKIESEALKILLKEHPVASDLRAISTALKIVTDMERIGDQSSDICEIISYLCDQKYKTKLIDIPQMGYIAKTMVNQCIDAYVRKDYDLAEKVIATDNSIDVLFHKVKREMVELIKSDSTYADQAIYLMMVAKYFEKIGDHAENIAQWVQFYITGERKNVKLI